MGDLSARDSGAVKCMTLHLWAANLKPFLVAHSCMAFTACCRCLSMVSRERPRKQIARSSTKSALKMSLAIQEGSSLILLQCVAYRTKRYNVDTRDWKTSHSLHLSYWHRIYSQMYEVTSASTSKGKSTTMGLSPTLLSHIQWVFLVCNSVAGLETTSVCIRWHSIRCPWPTASILISTIYCQQEAQIYFYLNSMLGHVCGIISGLVSSGMCWTGQEGWNVAQNNAYLMIFLIVFNPQP